MDGRKIPRNLENPFDNAFIDVAIFLNRKLFKPLKFITPNVITTLSLSIGLLSLYAFHKEAYLTFILFFLISYLLDCADGNFARQYGQVTRFGDFYDHISDMIKLAGLLILMVYSSIGSRSQKIVFFIGIAIFGLLANIHLGCQELLYETSSESEFLDLATSKLCPGKQWIHVTRYFGVGTLQLFIVFYVLWLI